MHLARIPISLRLLLLTAIVTSTTTAMPASFIFGRADTCTAEQVSCPSALPSNFCCSKDSTCKALAGDTTAVCCPSGSSCSKIQPITCDVSEQDPDKRPNASIKTTVFNVDLETCGSGCCPFGYTCKDKECIMNDDQSQAPVGANSSTTASTSTSATATSTGTETGTAAATATATDDASTTAVPGKSTESGGDSSSSNKNNAPATTSIIGGVVGACLILLIIAILIFLYIRRMKKADSAKTEKSGGTGLGISRAPSSAGSFGNIISDPILQPGSYRTDFIRKSPSRASDSNRSSTLVRSESTTIRATRIHHSPPRIRISIPNPFDSPNPSPNNPAIQPSPPDEEPRHGTVRLPPIRAMKASSYYSARPSSHELHKEPSSESINVFADPGTVKSRPLTRATTFTDLMDEADLGAVRRGRPYVPGTTPRI